MLMKCRIDKDFETETDEAFIVDTAAGYTRGKVSGWCQI